MTLVNMLAYLAQIAVVIIACAGIPRLLRLRSPVVQYLFWRIVLIVCLALPFIQPWRTLTFTATSLAAASVTPSVIPFVDKVSTPATGQAFYSPRFDPVGAALLVLAAGCAIRLLWLAIGIARLRSLRHAPATEAADGFDDLSAAIGVSAPILWSPKVRHPVTFGVWRPVILLPVALKSVDAGAQRAVVAHELHHVVRRDWAWLIAEEILRAVFWFHPAMWWLISRVQLARETVVDELSILVTNARRTYLDALLAFADDTGLGSPAFSARRHLFHRVMLLSKEGEMSSLRVAVGSGLLVAALGAGTWGAANAFPLYASPVAQTQTPPRDPKAPPRDRVPALTYHREAVEIWEKSRNASLTPEQRVELVRQGIALEDKALAINPDYVEALAYKNIFLRMEANETADAAKRQVLLDQADALRRKALEIRKTQPVRGRAGGPAPPPPPPAPVAITASDGSTSVVVPSPAAPMLVAPSAAYAAALAAYDPLRVGGEIKSPAKIRDVKPAYPAEARAAGVQGVVIVEILVDPAGEVHDVRVLRSIPILDEAALDAVRQWRFTPTLLNGEPRSLLMTVTVSFRLP